MNHYKVVSVVLAVLFCSAINVFAVNPPDHTTLLYSSSLDSDNDPDLGQITNRDGQFIAGSGWKATGSTSQLMISLPQGLPLEGTFSVKVTNFNPATQNISDKQQIINLYSQANGSKDIFDTHGSWVNIRTGTGYSSGPGMAGYKMLAAYDSKRHEDRYMHSATWNKNQTYEFTIVWDEYRIWTIVDGVLQGELEMTGSPVERFRYIFLGTDNVYIAQPGPIYKDLRIYSSDNPSDNALLFTDITSQSGAGGPAPGSGWYGHGVNFSDFDKDGDYDLMTTHAGGGSKDDVFFRNDGDNTFTNVTTSRNIQDDGNTHGVISGDIDNDGDLDVFMTNQPIGDNLPPGRNRLYRNDGNGSFTEITDAAGITDEYLFSRGGAMADFNNDGWLDIFVVNWGDPNALYLNDGTGKFNRVHRGTDGPAGDQAGRQGITTGDIDNDGDIDIYVCRRDAINWLFINDGNANFTEEAAARNVDGSSAIRSHGATFVDVDNDGDLDIFVMNYAQGGGSPEIPLMYAFINNGNGYFSDQTNQYNIRASGYSLIFGDVDNDADQDLYLIRNDEKEPGVVPKIYTNDGNGNLTARNIAGAGVSAGAARGSGFGDIDNDGDLDAYIACVNSNNFLLRNDLDSDNHYIDVLCVGPGGDYGGYGTKVSVYEAGFLGNPDYLIGYQEAVNGTAYMCQSQTAVHFGLADFDQCDIRVEFLGGQTADYYAVSADQVIEATANPPIPTTLERISNNVLQGAAGQVIPDSVKVRVVDDSNRGVGSHPVSFTITSGDGTLNGSSRTQVDTTTDNRGYAMVAWTAGTLVNLANSLSVESAYESSPLINSPLGFTALVNPGPDTLITIESGNLQNAVPEAVLPDSIKVFVHDSYNNAQANVPVNFQVISGNGNIDGNVSNIVSTNQDGMAAVQWTLGNAVGENSHALKASLVSDAQTAVTFTASTSTAPITSLIYVSGNNQSGTVAQPLATPFVVQLKDSLGNPRGGFNVKFKVTGGGGNFAGPNEQMVATDITGKASATLTLGQTAGTNVNTVEASYNGIDDIVSFTASGTAGVAASMQKNGGDNQTTGVGQNTAVPLSVLIKDQYENPVAGHDVIFTVNNNKGRVNNQLSATVQSNAQGIAQVTFTLGDLPGAYSVNVTSTQNGTPLSGSPLVFNATATSEPTRLVKVSGDSATGISNQQLVLPLQVKVADENGYPVSNYPVTFISESGGGTFEGNLQIQKTTNDQGIASVYPTLGNRVGPFIYIFSAKAYGQSGQHLTDSPVTFHISAKSTLAEKIELISGDLQSGQAGEFLPAAIQVMVKDDENNPVANHNVQFAVTKGSGKLGAGQTTTTTIKSGANGVAKVNFRLGSEIGDSLHAVEISSTDGITSLENSPITIYAHAEYGQPDPEKSSMIISDSVIPANGSSELLVSVQLRDAQNQPVPGEQVILAITGSDNTITQPTGVTDENGQASGRITSTKAETKTVSATINGKDITLQDTETVNFTAGPAQNLSIVSGNNQTGTINSVLPQSLLVRVDDAMGNPIGNHQVTFQTSAGNGSIQPQQILNTDSAGVAQVNWVLGPQVGTQNATASANGVATTVTFTATGQVPGTAYIIKTKGDGQFASPTAIFTDSLTIRILDANENPISGIPVKFRIDQGDASLNGNSTVNSNSFGYAAIQLVAGELLGTIKINAAINDDQSVNFTCTISSSLPDTMLHVFGNNTQGTVGSQVFPLTVQVLDNNSNPISGVPVTFASSDTSASVIDDQPLFTASNGQASAHVMLGAVAGTYRFTASNSNLKGSPVTFDLTALPDNAESLLMVSGNGQTGNPLESLPEPLQVKIIDQFGNGIENIQINYTVTSGGGTIVSTMPAVTDNEGIASAEWQLGASGSQIVTAQTAVIPGQSIQFSAELRANNLPVVTAITDTTISETQTLVFQVEATDPEGTDVTLWADTLPTGAEFDGAGSGQFSWTPGYTDQGEYTITFYARDENGGTKQHDVQIIVQNVNRMPAIQSTIPEQTTLSVQTNILAAFEINVTDADQDPLHYRWFVNGSLVRSQNDSTSIVIQPNETWPSQFNVKVLVTDTMDSTNHIWTVNMLQTSIELISFQANTVKDEITISWETKREIRTAGYNILRSSRKDGPYQVINNGLILPSTDQYYELTDQPDNQNLVYYYKLEEVESTGATQTFDAVRAEIALPTSNRLLQNYPNPFNPVTTIQYELASPQHIDIHIFNLSGQLIKTLASEEQKAGYHQLVWDSKNARGIPVSTGIYYCLMVGKDYRNTIKLLLLK